MIDRMEDDDQIDDRDILDDDVISPDSRSVRQYDISCTQDIGAFPKMSQPFIGGSHGELEGGNYQHRAKVDLSRNSINEHYSYTSTATGQPQQTMDLASLYMITPHKYLDQSDVDSEEEEEINVS